MAALIDSRTQTEAATVPATMQAIVQEGSGSADHLHLREVPTPALEDARVVVKVKAASANALDWHTVHGGFLLDVISALMRQKNDPIRGADLSGIVAAVGKDVTELAVGDEVFGSGRGTFAEYCSSLPRALVRKPKEVSFEQAAAIYVAGSTALQGLRDHGHLVAGQRVLIHGAGGGVGTFAVQIAKTLGAHVTAVTGPKNVDVVRALDPDVLIDYSKEDVRRRPDRYDVILDVAATKSIASMRKLLRPGGMFVQTGAAKGSWLSVFARIIAIVIRSRLLKQRVVMFIARNRQADLTLLGDWIAAGKIRPVIDRTYALADAPAAVAYLGTGQARGKVVITVS